MKTYITILLVVITVFVYGQERTSIVHVSHYVNPVLYLQGGVIAFVCDASGKASPKGKYISIKASDQHPFSYKQGDASWKLLKAGQRTIVPLSTPTAGRTKLNVKYRPQANINLSSKINTLTQMNKLTDAVTEGKITARPVAKTQTSKSNSSRVVAKVSPGKTAASSRKPVAAKKPVNKISETKSPSCFFVSEPAYYTFYYLRSGNEVYYTDSFPVPAYADEYAAEDLQHEFFNCLIGNLREQVNEDQLIAILNNPDFQIEDGLMHLRNPSIPSDEIARTYPYTASYETSQRERDNWIRFDREQSKDLKFVKVDL
ncbi:hypothetical protein [Pedobacter sp. SYSU D00535]|uniref:hypothetical protein n=1 Tax=Pedobacter sp. SYSU D00535 TaxID=2810308 RepID=UPI001A963FE5|nr:hypothetical protein [Pedobacter sp. SYSU D00535]